MEARALHCHMLRAAADTYSANCVADAYRKAGFLEVALGLLDEIPHPNAISWNLKISIHNQRRHLVDSLRSLHLMRAGGCRPTEVTYGSILSACAMAGELCFGRQLQALVVKNGFSSNGYVAAGLVDLFAKNRRLGEMAALFSENPTTNVVVWNAAIAGAVRNGEHRLALGMFLQMAGGISSPNEFTFSTVLTACAGAGELPVGRAVHGLVVKSGAGGDVVVGSALVDLYAKCGDTGGAASQFSEMTAHNVVSWTTLISAFSLQDPRRAFSLFGAMRATAAAGEMNRYTLTSVLAACGSPDMTAEAAQLHGCICKSGFSGDPVVRAAMVNAYAKAGKLPFSEELFEEEEVDDDEARGRDVGSSAAMISAFAMNPAKSFQAFRRMLRDGLKPDEICCCSVLRATSSMAWGKQVHSLVVKSGLVVFLPVAGALLTMYSKCGSLCDSKEFFREMPEKDGIAWTSMIAGLAEHGRADEALDLFREMMVMMSETTTATAVAELDETTLSYAVTACAELRNLVGGKEAHGRAIRLGFGEDAAVVAALISMYSKCGALSAAAGVFRTADHKNQNQLAWSAMVAGYARNGAAGEALSTFIGMLAAGLGADHFACSAAAAAAGELCKPAAGKQLHALATKTGTISDLSVGSAVVAMYAACGSIQDSRRAFDQVTEPDVVACTAMIDGYSKNGRAEEALRIFDQMRRKGTTPDSLTFVTLLSACSHCGMMEEGLRLFRSMEEDHGVKPEAAHYACVVDLLGRAGKVKEAAAFIEDMAAEPTAAVWGALLWACRANGEIELGRLAAEKILELEPGDSGAYVSLSNLSADVGDWKAALDVRGSMRLAGVKKEAGWSFVG
ncbi:unnamed protein product [Spirodela intermedia]|uniref:Uncharacterized protein n=1 Tax=Spirodela intermedia TaxID=51605 RepID=A0A7I8KWL1_SPIIN|nr:unnamed protein product [Spirodela intermedia]